MVKLWSGNATDSTVTLEQSVNNFRYLLIISSESEVWTTTNIIPSIMYSEITSSRPYVCCMYDNHYICISAINDKSVTIYNSGNSGRIDAIYGIK